VSQAFGDDALGYFTERLDPAPTLRALADGVRRAKRNKAFDNRRFIGLSVDGTTVGRCRASTYPVCRHRAHSPLGRGALRPRRQ